MEKVVLIMAGGSGSRLWPLSRKTLPKQAHRLFSNVSSFERILKLALSQVPIDHIFVTVGESQYEYVKQSSIIKNHILYQRQNKNTAPAILYCIDHIQRHLGDCTIAMLPSDHMILEEEKYIDALQLAFEAAEEKSTIIAIGTRPIYPSTGFGYIEREMSDHAVQKVVSFKEKPTKELAVVYSMNQHLWNTGIYVSKVKELMQAFTKNLPDLVQELTRTDQFFDHAASISFDIGIIEKLENLHVVVSNHMWMDTGTYEFLEHFFDSDESGNTIHGKALTYDSCRTSVVSDNRVVVTFGINDALIVNTNDVVFICDKNHIQNIGKLVEHMEENGGKELL